MTRLMTRSRGHAAIAVFCALWWTPAALGTQPFSRHIEEGLLDLIDLHVEKPPENVPIVIRPFASDKADLGTGAEGGKETRTAAAKTLQHEGPGLLAESFLAEMKKQGVYSEVRIDDASAIADNALIIEGEFTMIDPGSKAKRYWGGFGAGKSGLEVKGVVKNAAGQVLAEFRQKRIGVMGVFGGDYEGKLRSDCKSVGEDIAVFLSSWAKGKNLEED